MYKVKKETIEAVLEKNLNQGGPENFYHDTKARMRLENPHMWDAFVEFESDRLMSFTMRVIAVGLGMEEEDAEDLLDHVRDEGSFSTENIPDHAKIDLDVDKLRNLLSHASAMCNGASVDTLLMYTILRSQHASDELEREEVPKVSSKEDKTD